MPTITPKFTPRMPVNYTGEGFKGEKLLAIFAVTLTIVSTILLIKVSLMQHTQIKLELEAIEKKKKQELEKNKKT